MPCPDKFAESLKLFGIEQSVIDEIYDGYANIAVKSPKRVRAAFFKRAVDVLEQHAQPQTVRELLEWNACCKSGAREKHSKEFARINAGLPLEEKLAKLRKAPYLNMGEPWLCEDGTLRINAVSYFDEGKFHCGCSNFRRVPRDYPVSRTYCCCCAGHFRYHYELMLGVKLALDRVVASPLDTDGKEPCVFTFRFV